MEGEGNKNDRGWYEEFQDEISSLGKDIQDDIEEINQMIWE